MVNWCFEQHKMMLGDGSWLGLIFILSARHLLNFSVCEDNTFLHYAAGYGQMEILKEPRRLGVGRWLNRLVTSALCGLQISQQHTAGVWKWSQNRPMQQWTFCRSPVGLGTGPYLQTQPFCCFEEKCSSITVVFLVWPSMTFPKSHQVVEISIVANPKP